MVADEQHGGVQRIRRTDKTLHDRLALLENVRHPPADVVFIMDDWLDCQIHRLVQINLLAIDDQAVRGRFHRHPMQGDVRQFVIFITAADIRMGARKPSLCNRIRRIEAEDIENAAAFVNRHGMIRMFHV